LREFARHKNKSNSYRKRQGSYCKTAGLLLPLVRGANRGRWRPVPTHGAALRRSSGDGERWGRFSSTSWRSWRRRLASAVLPCAESRRGPTASSVRLGGGARLAQATSGEAGLGRRSFYRGAAQESGAGTSRTPRRGGTELQRVLAAAGAGWAQMGSARAGARRLVDRVGRV
jgi:hypothetical protein